MARMKALRSRGSYAVPGLGRLGSALARREWTPRPFAPAPSGSGLRPVMGDPGLPVLGHVLEMMRLGPQYGLQRYRRYGAVSWGSGFGVRMIQACGPEATQTVLLNKDKAYSQSGWEHFIGPFFNRGLMLLDFAEHHEHRRIMQEAFTRQRLASYQTGVEQRIATTIPEWGRQRDFRLYPAMRQLSLDVAESVFMGVTPGADSARLTTAFNDLVHGGTALIRRDVPGGTWARGLAGRRLMEQWFRATIPAKRAGDGDDLFNVLCQVRTDEGERFTDEDVVNHMIFLMMAAHDTSTTTTCAVAYYLAAYPEWQERVRAESLALGDGPLDLEALDRMPSLDLVMNEAMRLVAPVPMLMRRATHDTDLCGHYIPAGAHVILLPAVNHQLPDCWTQPHRFDPERFAEPRREDKAHRFLFVPFGGGPHKCIGMQFGQLEVKTVIHHLVTRFELGVPPGYRVPWDFTALPMPADRLPLRLRARTRAPQPVGS